MTKKELMEYQRMLENINMMAENKNSNEMLKRNPQQLTYKGMNERQNYVPTMAAGNMGGGMASTGNASVAVPMPSIPNMNQPASPNAGPLPLPTPSLPDINQPVSPGEGPIPLPTPSLPDINQPVSPGEGPFPLPTPSVPSKPQPPVRPSPIPPWITVKPDACCKGACLPFAYPPIEVSDKNESVACIIFGLFAGRISEVTAVMTYLYDSSYFMEENKEAYETFNNIALCEMNHLKMLSKLLVKLGVAPKYQGCDNGQYTWWNAGPSNMVYPTFLKMALLENIDGENKAIEAYNNAIKKISDPYITTLLRRIVMDEEHHIELLSDLYNRCCK